MLNKNPFTLMYGIESQSIVTRSEELEKILKSFLYNDNMYAYIITGIRRSGKTVLLKSIEKSISTNPNWAVININPQSDIITSLANKLFNLDILKKELNKWTITINLGGIVLTRDNGDSVTDPEIIIEQIMKKAQSLNIKLLISIDEVNDTKDFRKFINFYQILIGKKYPIYLLMTALKENVNELINDKAMTFLSRAPKIELEPLSLVNIAKEYMEIFNIDLNSAIDMAKLTNGYAFAYQVLGYLFYESSSKSLSQKFISEYEKYLWNNGYNKFWKDLTKNEKAFLIALSVSQTGEKKDILANLNGNKSIYPIYRERLLEKGLIYSPSYGKLEFVLPRFKEYITIVKEFE